MTHTILVQNQVAALNVDSYNRSVISGSNIDNGWVFMLSSKSSTTGEAEVWNATWTTSGSLTGLWMAASPEVVLTDSRYKGIDPNPLNFYNVAGEVFDAFKPQAGDIITLTADALDGSTPLAYAYVPPASHEFMWGSVLPTGLALKYLNTTYVSVGASASTVTSGRVTAFQFEVLSN